MTTSWTYPNQTYTVLVVIEKDEDGQLFVWVPRLPGCISQGDTVDECVANIREAFQGCIESYVANNMPIPWSREPFVKPAFSEVRSVSAKIPENLV